MFDVCLAQTVVLEYAKRFGKTQKEIAAFPSQFHMLPQNAGDEESWWGAVRLNCRL